MNRRRVELLWSRWITIASDVSGESIRMPSGKAAGDPCVPTHFIQRDGDELKEPLVSGMQVTPG